MIALASAWLGTAGCDGWPINAGNVLDLIGKKGSDSTAPASKDDAGSAAGGDKTQDPAAGTSQCKVSSDANGVPCKVCVDASGNIVSDGCSAGTGGTGGEPPPQVKCDATTDPKTGAACKTCWAADGTVTSNDCAPPAQTGTSASCTASKNATGDLCKICSDENGKIVFTDCGDGAGGTAPPGPVSCKATTDPATGSVCKTCWAADGTVTASDCTPPSQTGTSASCTASKNATGDLCKVCSDENGKVVFTDCGATGG